MDDIEEFVYDRLPDGWEINDGSYGTVVFDLTQGNISFEHNQRYTDVTTEEWEV